MLLWSELQGLQQYGRKKIKLCLIFLDLVLFENTYVGPTGMVLSSTSGIFRVNTSMRSMVAWSVV